MSGFKRVLVISDLHAPFGHPDTIPFLKALKKKYHPDKVILTGDEADLHAVSFHDHSPDLMSPSDELERAINHLTPIYKLFPKADILESNHGSLFYRKAKAFGLPRSVIKSYRDVLQAPRGWHWHFDLIVPLSDGTKCYFHHGKAASGLKLSQGMGMSTCQGHFHEAFSIQYWGNPLGLFWSMQVGCMVDWDSLAMEYAKNNMKRQMIGCGVIINGHPKLEPMVLNSKGRWTKKLI